MPLSSTVAALHYSTPRSLWSWAVELASAQTAITIMADASHPTFLESRNDLKCVKWGVKRYHTHTQPTTKWIRAYLINSPYSSHLIFSSLQGNIGYAFFACLKNPVFVFACRTTHSEHINTVTDYLTHWNFLEAELMSVFLPWGQMFKLPDSFWLHMKYQHIIQLNAM